MKARLARQIRRRSRERSARPDHLGVSELFTAPEADRQTIHAMNDPRMLLWLLGFSKLPDNDVAGLRARGLNWAT